MVRKCYLQSVGPSCGNPVFDDVAVNYLRRQDAAEEVAASVKAIGRRCGSYAADVADLDHVRAMVQAVERDLGAPSMCS